MCSNYQEQPNKFNNRVTLKWLEEKGACPKGRRWFEARFPEDGLLLGPYTWEVLASCTDVGWVRWFLHEWYEE